MDGHETARWDVAAYALGVLDHREIERYEQHLAECPSCAAELEFLLPASRLLADVDPADISAAEDSRLVDRLIDAVRVDRDRSRRRHRITVGVGTAVAAALAAFAVLAGMTWLETIPTDEVAGESPVPASPSGRPAGGGDGEPVSVTDPDSGVQIEALLESTDWGTQLSFAISEVTGPRECQLVVVHSDGTEEVVGSWRVPPAGYGTEAQPSPLRLEAATRSDRADIDELRVREMAPDGTVSATLATVPV
jgi:Putative zinc-finger